MDNYIYTEKEVISSLINLLDFPSAYFEKYIQAYNIIKSYLPYEYRNNFKFYFHKKSGKGDNFVSNIMNYRIFKISVQKQELFYQICYPLDHIYNLKQEPEINDNYILKSAPVIFINFTVDEILDLSEYNLEDFSTAIKMLANAKKSKEHNNNVHIDWSNSNGMVIKEFSKAKSKDTETLQIVKARVGQGFFKQKLKKQSCRCKICGLSNEVFLIASHIKPWADSNNEERIDINNGFLLCPQHDALFDKGYITFNDDGIMIISPKISLDEYRLLGIHNDVRINISEENKRYLKWHREIKFIKF